MKDVNREYFDFNEDDERDIDALLDKAHGDSGKVMYILNKIVNRSGIYPAELFGLLYACLPSIVRDVLSVDVSLEFKKEYEKR